eukprot:Rhum_TRINITY_DN14584_c12_g1::Rhum_TRINITY_DN14584_c12_g1_i1::g.99624::m.99624
MPITRRCVAAVLSTVVLAALAAALLSPRVPLRWAALRSQLRDASGAAAVAVVAPDAARRTRQRGRQRVTRVTAGAAAAAGGTDDLRLVWAASGATGAAPSHPTFTLREEGSGLPLFDTSES